MDGVVQRVETFIITAESSMGLEEPSERRFVLNHDLLKKPTMFIVHGHDTRTMLEVKNYLQNNLHFPEPIILREQSSFGRTVIEQFETHANRADGAIILLTPDDQWVENGTNEEFRRARQNVIFELGYFYAKFGRESGKVLLFYKGKLDLPSDIRGVIYIDITNGLESASDKIRRELTGRD